MEASSACQLRCPSCPTTDKSILPVVGSGFLRFKDFQKIIDENLWLEQIELSNYGEMFLNPELLDIIKYAYEHHVVLTADNGVNLNHVKREVLEGLVKYKFGSMSLSIDGASNDTYPIYRVRGNYDAVMANVKTINLFKAQYHSEYPQLKWQFIVFGHNIHELPAAKALAKKLNISFRPKLSWDSESFPIKNEDKKLLAKYFGVASREEYREKFGVDYMRGICYQLWDIPQINWDGKVLGCCRNFWGDFGGNAFTDGLLASLNNDKFNYARGMLLGRHAARDDIPCSTCGLYLDMKKTGKWLDRTPKKERLEQKIKRAIKLKIKRLFA